MFLSLCLLTKYVCVSVRRCRQHHALQFVINILRRFRKRKKNRFFFLKKNETLIAWVERIANAVQLEIERYLIIYLFSYCFQFSSKQTTNNNHKTNLKSSNEHSFTNGVNANISDECKNNKMKNKNRSNCVYFDLPPQSNSAPSGEYYYFFLKKKLRNH